MSSRRDWAVWRARVFVCACALLAGCAPGAPLSLHKEPEFLKVPLQPTRNLWATIRQTGKARILYAQGKCQRKELSAAECAQIDEDIRTVLQLDYEISRALDNPKADLDVEKVARVLEVTAKIVGALVP